jgi:immunity protein Imm1 of predicted polymorphic toxin system
MSARMSLDYGAGPTSAGPILNVAQLDAEIDRITVGASCYLPCLITLRSATGALLAMGAGAASSVLAWTDGRPGGLMLSRGGPAGPGGERFFYGGDWLRVERSCLIPVPAARAAMRLFLLSGGALPEVPALGGGPPGPPLAWETG